jgi:hypothetical protein
MVEISYIAYSRLRNRIFPSVIPAGSPVFPATSDEFAAIRRLQPTNRLRQAGGGKPLTLQLSL